MIHAILEAIQTILLGWFAGCIVALIGLLRSLWRGEVF